MKTIKKLALSVLMSVISMSSVFADHHGKPSVRTSTLKEFRELCGLLEGRWNSDILWINEWPGANAVRGETVRGPFQDYSYPRRGSVGDEINAGDRGERLEVILPPGHISDPKSIPYEWRNGWSWNAL